MNALHLQIEALAGATRPASVLTRNIANRFQCDLDSEICNSDSWKNGIPPNIELTLEEAKDIAENLCLLERIGGAA